MPFIDLSHPLENGMPSFRIIQYSIQIRPFITHQQSRPRYDGLAEPFKPQLVPISSPPFIVTVIAATSASSHFPPIPTGRALGYEPINANASPHLENLANHVLPNGNIFRFFTVLLKVKGAAMPVQAFAEIHDRTKTEEHLCRLLTYPTPSKTECPASASRIIKAG